MSTTLTSALEVLLNLTPLSLEVEAQALNTAYIFVKLGTRSRSLSELEHGNLFHRLEGCAVIKEVPVIRIFGVTESGEKTCAHIHNVFPYLCVPIPDMEGAASSFSYKLAENLDSAINSSFGGSNRQLHVHNISEISALPFYGFHSTKQRFLKIEFYRPSIIKRAVEILQAGTIFNQKFQPHEAHVPFILQFFIEYNLHGMTFINLSQVTYRMKSSIETASEAKALVKVTSCKVEVDTVAEYILNRLEAPNEKSLNPGLSSIREEEVRRLAEDGMDQSGFTMSDSRGVQPTKSDLHFRNLFIKGIKERRRAEVDETLSQSQSSPSVVTFDNEDVSVLKVLLDRIVAADEVPDEDSILGSWSPHLEDSHEEEMIPIDNQQGRVEEDLSQPFISFIEMSDSDEEAIPSNQKFSSEAGIDLDSNTEWRPQYVDGNDDDSGSAGRKQKRTENKRKLSRYQPLDVQLFKSPHKTRTINKKAASSPELFRTLEEKHSQLRKIKSPKIKRTQADLSANRSSSLTTCSSLLNKEFCGYKGRTAKSRSRIDSHKASTSKPEKPTEILSVKKVLFKEREIDTPRQSSQNIINDCDDGATAIAGGTASILMNVKILAEDKPLAPTDHSIIKGLAEVEAASVKSNVVGTALVLTDVEDLSKIKEDVASSTAEENDLESKDIILSDNSSIISASISPPSGKEEVKGSELTTNSYDSDDNLTLPWTDVNATQNSITSFYGDTTLYSLTQCSSKILTPSQDPPSSFQVEQTMAEYNINKTKPIEPFNSDPSDRSTSKKIGFNIINLKSMYLADLEEFAGQSGAELNRMVKCSRSRLSRRHVVLQPAMDPPPPDKVITLCEKEDEHESFNSSIIPLTPEEELSFEQQSSLCPKKLTNKLLTQVEREKRQSGEIELTSSNNSGQFKLDFQNLQEAHSTTQYRYTTLMVLEVHTATRGNLCPDPEYDAIQAVFYLIVDDIPPDHQLPSRKIGAVVVAHCTVDNVPFDFCLESVGSEEQLFHSFLAIVSQHDPDIVAGYEVEMLSWGYLIQRGYTLGLNLLGELSRLKNRPDPPSAHAPKQLVENDYELKLPGRIVLNVWRLMRHEVALMSYSFENIMYHVLHTRVPKFSHKTLSHWWTHLSNKYRHLVMKHYLTMVDGTGQLIDQLDLIRRTSELASLFGIQFYEVFSRGSQFRVESMMLRLAKRLGFIAVSPSMTQRAHMMAPQSLPLIMEPESRFYGDPVIVLDFQSLYPSMMIAYNYCFSTCLGRLADLIKSDEIKFGCTVLKTDFKELLKLQNNIHVSPAGVVFVDKSIRKGVLPQMLEEILETRLLVKGSIKRHRDKKLLVRSLDARQLGLKLIANVTYGYTSANFSGRMPCIEIGDSVVSKGRETLERAIRLVEETTEWGARVVYGDTDSLFVLCPGRSREEAFTIGQDIAERVTNDNPSPVKLKLEKVYHPCILQTKKRYVGYMYESPDQKSPVYHAKGIETVRRDGCPAVSKILEKSLKLLFDNGDMSTVRQYVRQQLTKVLSGRLSPAELSFAREYRGISGYHPSAPVPALKIARELLAQDKRAEPRKCERVPYVVVCGPPGLPLIALVRHLPAYLNDCTRLVLNADYYITKAILPPLDRCLSLLGADVFSWYGTLPKKQLFRGQQLKGGVELRKATISQYFATVSCVVCSHPTPLGLCHSCQANPRLAIAHLSSSLNTLERKAFIFEKICQSCCRRGYETDCVSLDCPVLFRRVQTSHDKMQTTSLRYILDSLISEVT